LLCDDSAFLALVRSHRERVRKLGQEIEAFARQVNQFRTGSSLSLPARTAGCARPFNPLPSTLAGDGAQPVG
jgi:hypothetical protein